jgi:hypothetical protein
LVSPVNRTTFATQKLALTSRPLAEASHLSLLDPWSALTTVGQRIEEDYYTSRKQLKRDFQILEENISSGTPSYPQDGNQNEPISRRTRTI